MCSIPNEENLKKGESKTAFLAYFNTKVQFPPISSWFGGKLFSSKSFGILRNKQRCRTAFIIMSCGYCCWTTISTSEVGVIESFGKFSRLTEPGCTCLACPCEYLSGIISLKVQQLNVTFETKTKDNVFVNIQISIQYQAIRDKVIILNIINIIFIFKLK